MPRQSLLEYFRPDSRPSSEIAVVWRRGYRTIRWSYGELLGIATGFAEICGSHGIAKGDRVLIWGENSGEWIAAFLGCMFQGAIAVPMDAIAEKGFARRVAQQAGVRLAIVGRGLSSPLKASNTVSLEDLGDIAGRGPVRDFSPTAASSATRSKLFLLRAPRRSRVAWCSRTGTCWRISSRSKRKSRDTGATSGSFIRCDSSICCR